MRKLDEKSKVRKRERERNVRDLKIHPVHRIPERLHRVSAKVNIL